MLLYILYLKVYIVYILMARPPPSSAYLVHGHSFMPLIHLFQVSIDRC